VLYDSELRNLRWDIRYFRKGDSRVE